MWYFLEGYCVFEVEIDYFSLQEKDGCICELRVGRV